MRVGEREGRQKGTARSSCVLVCMGSWADVACSTLGKDAAILEALKAAVLGLLLRSDELLNERTLALIFLDIHRLLCSHLCHFNMKLKRPNDTIFLYILTSFHSYSVTKSTDNRQINILFDNQVLYSVSVLLRVAAATTNYLRNFRPNVVSVDMGFRLLLWMVKRSKHRLDDFEADF